MDVAYNIDLARHLLSYGYNYYQLQQIGIHGYTIDKAANRRPVAGCKLSDEELLNASINIYSPLNKTYYTRTLSLKGYDIKTIASMLDSTPDQIRSLLKAIKKKENRQETREFKAKAIGQYRTLKGKKIDIEMIIETLKFHGWHKAMKRLRIYVYPSTVRGGLKRYNVSKKDIENKKIEDIKEQIVNQFLVQKTGYTLDNLSALLLQGNVTAIGVKEWDRLRNLGLTKKKIMSNKERIRKYLIDVVWDYLKYSKTPLSPSRGAQYYRIKNNASSKEKNGIILFLCDDKTTAGMQGEWYGLNIDDP